MNTNDLQSENQKKTCRYCNRSLLTNCFVKRSDMKDGFASGCKQCAAAKTIVWRRNNPERCREQSKQKRVKKKEAYRKYQREWATSRRKEIWNKYWQYGLRKQYGLSAEDYFKMLSAQNNACAICLKTPKTKLHVDHDHINKKVRGLL